MIKYYRKLRTLLFENDITQRDIAEMTGRSLAYVNNCFCRRTEWTLTDIYIICDKLKIPYADISIYFPNNGGVNSKKEVAAC